MNSFESPAVALVMSRNEKVSLQLPVEHLISKTLHDKNEDNSLSSSIRKYTN